VLEALAAGTVFFPLDKTNNVCFFLTIAHENALH